MKTNRLSSLGLKVLTTYILGTVIAIGLFVAAAVWLVQKGSLSNFEIWDRAESIAERVKFNENSLPIGIEAETDDDLMWLHQILPNETAYRILDAKGNTALISKEGIVFWVADDKNKEWKKETFIFQRNGTTFHAATVPFEHNGKQWYLQVAASERLMKLLHDKYALPHMGKGIGLFSVILIISFGFYAYTALRKSLKPLSDLSDAAANISHQSLHSRLQTESIPAEISPLVNSFNKVLDRLEHGKRLQQEFLANAAHELKTPLSLIRMQIEMPMEEAHTRKMLLSDVDYMTRQVQQLLILAEVSETTNYKFAYVPIHDLVLEVITYLNRAAESATVSLKFSDPHEEVIWWADRGALFTLLKNLIENAIQHAPASTEVYIDINQDAITVRDSGPGVELSKIPLIFERFWRGAHRREIGAGLGLAICQEISFGHGWQLSAERAEPGLRFRLVNTKLTS